MLPPDPDKPKGLSGFFSTLTPLQQGGVVLGGLATLTAVAMPLLFSDGLTLFGVGGDKSGGHGAFARKGEPAPKADAPAPAGLPDASPLPMPGQTLSSAVRPQAGGGPLSAGLAPGGPAGGAGAGGAPGAAAGLGAGGRGGGPLGPQGMVVDGGAAAGGKAKGPGRGVALEPTAPLVSLGAGGGGRGSVPTVSVPQGGAGPGGGIAPDAQSGGGGGGLSSDGGLHEGRQNALQDSDGGEADEDESRCEQSVRARFDAMIDQKFDAYVRAVTDRRAAGCQGIPCSVLNDPGARCENKFRASSHRCRCARMACNQDRICQQGNQIRCQKQKACAANPPAACDGFKCDLDPS